MSKNQKFHDFTNHIKLALEYCVNAHFIRAQGALIDAQNISNNMDCKYFSLEIGTYAGLISTQQHARVIKCLTRFCYMLNDIAKLLDPEDK